ncbi:MAG: DUF4097 family beta strand repeat-containing protein [Bacillota bacterium]|nr:DUF4097 family beta strand repeat-containing protein [Bacillota bacterium]
MTDKERVLKMLEDGKVTPEEAIKMLELLGVEEKENRKEEFVDFDSDFGFEGKHEERSRDAQSGEKSEKFAIFVDVQSMDIVVRTSVESEKVEYRFVDADTEERIPVPEHVDVYYGTDRIKISENFFKNFGPKMASGSIGKKVIDMLGLTANHKFNGVLEIDIPLNKVIGEAKFATKSGDVRVDGINTVERLAISSVSGDLMLSDIVCDKIFLNAVSGDIIVNGVTANAVKSNCVSGDLKLIGKTPEVDVNCVSGDIKIVNDMLLYNSRISSVSGDIKLYVADEERQNYSVSGMNKPKNMKGRADGEVGTGLKMNTMSGSVKLLDRSKYEGQSFH